MGIISITSCQGLPMRDLIPLSTDKWLTNNWPMTDRYCAISYQFFWLESLFLVILDCKSILVLLIYWFYEIFPSISIFNNVFILFFRCCCNKYVTGVITGVKYHFIPFAQITTFSHCFCHFTVSPLHIKELLVIYQCNCLDLISFSFVSIKELLS